MEVDNGYYFINYTTIDKPGAGPAGEDMVVVTATDRCVVNKHGIELFGQGSICLCKQQLMD